MTASKVVTPSYFQQQAARCGQSNLTLDGKITLRPDWNGPTTYIAIGVAAALPTMQGRIVVGKVKWLVCVSSTFT